MSPSAAENLLNLKSNRALLPKMLGFTSFGLGLYAPTFYVLRLVGVPPMGNLGGLLMFLLPTVAIGMGLIAVLHPVNSASSRILGGVGIVISVLLIAPLLFGLIFRM